MKPRPASLLRAPARLIQPPRLVARARFVSDTVEAPKGSLWARSKQLAKTHGRIYTAVYLGLSLVDFSIVFAIVLAGGGQYVRATEDWALKNLDRRKTGEANSALVERIGDWAQRHRHTGHDADLDSKKSDLSSSLWTSAALAYGIHKILLLPVRLGFTIALTPWVVRTLRARGWNVAGAKTVSAAPSSTTRTL